MRHDSSPSPERSIHTRNTDKVEAIANIPHTVLERFHQNRKQIHEKYRLTREKQENERKKIQREGEQLKSLFNKYPKTVDVPATLKKAKEQHQKNAKALEDEMLAMAASMQKELQDNDRRFREEVAKKPLRDDDVKKPNLKIVELPEIESVKRDPLDFDKINREVAAAQQAKLDAELDNEFEGYSVSSGDDASDDTDSYASYSATDESQAAVKKEETQDVKWEEVLSPVKGSGKSTLDESVSANKLSQQVAAAEKKRRQDFFGTQVDAAVDAAKSSQPTVFETVRANSLSRSAVAAERKKREDALNAEVNAAVSAIKPAPLTVGDVRRAESLQNDLARAEALKSLKNVTEREIDAAVSGPGTSGDLRPSEKLIAKQVNRATMSADVDTAFSKKLAEAELTPQEKMALIEEHAEIVRAQDKANLDKKDGVEQMDKLVKAAREKDLKKYLGPRIVRDRKAALTDLRDSLRMPRSEQKPKPYLDASAGNPGAFDNMVHDQSLEKGKNLAYAIRFPGTEISYRSGEYVKLPQINGKTEAVQLKGVPEIIYDTSGKENGVTFTYTRTDGSTETKTYYEPLEKVGGSEIQSVYRPGDVVVIPNAKGFELAVLVDRPQWNTEASTGETSYVYTYQKADGTTETKAYYEPLQKTERRFSEEDLAKYQVGDFVQLNINGKKIGVYLTEKPRVEFDENSVQKVLFTYDLGNGVVGTHYAEELPAAAVKEQAYIDTLPDLSKDAAAEAFPDLELGEEVFSGYAFGSYVLYEVDGKWNIGSIQAELRRIPSAGKVEFTVQNARTGAIEKFSVEKPPKIFKPLENKKVRVNGIDYTVEGGHIGLNGEVEYQLLSRRNEVVPNVDIETIRNLQEAEKVSEQMKDRIKAIESRIKDLSTNKVRDLMIQFNDLQVRMQKIGADFGNPRDWNDLGKDEIKGMERNIKKFRHDLDLNLSRLERSVAEQEEKYQEFLKAGQRKAAVDFVAKEAIRLGLSSQKGMAEKMRQENPEEYYRLFEKIYQKITEQPGNPLYDEIKKRLAQTVEDYEPGESIDLQNLHLRIFEQVINEWGAEKVSPPELNFDEEYEGQLKPKFNALKARVEELERKDKEKYDKVADLFFAAESTLNKVDKNNPKLPLELLKAWQAFGKLEVALASIESAERIKERRGGKLEEVELPTRVLSKMLQGRPAEMRRVAELMYLSEHDFSAKDIKENPEITAALRNIFSADVPPQPPIMAMLRVYGVKDWRSFKDVWDRKYATEVGMVLYDSIREDIKHAVSTTPDIIEHIPNLKKDSIITRFFSKPQEEVHEPEDATEKARRLSRQLFSEDLAVQPNGERTWLTPDAMDKFAAEIAIALRKVNIELSLEKVDLSGLDKAGQMKRLAKVIGVAENQVEHVLDIQDKGGKKEYFLKKNAHRIIEDQIASLDDRLGFTGASKTAERLGVANLSENVPLERAYTPEGDFDEEFVGQKRGELKGLIGQVNTRIEKIMEKRKQLKDSWMNDSEAKGAMSLLAEEVAKLETYFKGTSTDKVLVEMAKSPAFRPVVEAAILEGLQFRAELNRSIERKAMQERLKVIEGGLSKVEAAGRKKVAESKQHRQVVDAFRAKKKTNDGGFLRSRSATALALAGLVALGLGKMENSPGKHVEDPSSSRSRSRVVKVDRTFARGARPSVDSATFVNTAPAVSESGSRVQVPDVRQQARGEYSTAEMTSFLGSILSTIDVPNGLDRSQVQANLQESLDSASPDVRRKFLNAVNPQNAQSKEVLRTAISTLYASGETSPNMSALWTYLNGTFGQPS